MVSKNPSRSNSSDLRRDSESAKIKNAKRRLKHEGIRKWLYLRVLEGTKYSLAIQRHRNFFWDHYFMLATFCGDKLFYMTLIPCFFWFGNPEMMKLGRLFLLLLTTAVYVANFLKELLALPRPPSPPVWRNKTEHDYGLPSSHTASSLSVSVFLLSSLVRMGYVELNIWTILAASIWVVSIAISRLYLGHHSPADLTAGAILGLSLTYVWYHYGNVIDDYVVNHSSVPLFICMLIFFLSLSHPRSIEGTPSYARSISIIGLAVGVIYGSWVSKHSTPDAMTLFMADSMKVIVTGVKGSAFYPYLRQSTWEAAIRLAFGFTSINALFIIILKSSQFVFDMVFRTAIASKFIDRAVKTLSVLELPSFEPILQPETIKLAEEAKKNIKNAANDAVDAVSDAMGTIPTDPKESNAVSSRKKRRADRKKHEETIASLWSKFFSVGFTGYFLVYTIPTILDSMMISLA